MVSPRFMIQNLTCVFLALTALSCNGITPEPVQFFYQPYFFDAGGSKSELAEGSLPVISGFEYTNEYGYGFTSGGGEPFYHEGTERSRDAFLIDGIIGKDFEFKADLPEGDWWLTLWFELGMEDSVTTRFYVQGENIKPGFQPFSEGAEGRTQIDKTYRYFQHKLNVGSQGLTFRIQGIEDDVRLLGFSMLPNPKVPASGKALNIYKEIEEAGRFNSTTDLSGIINKLEPLENDPEFRNFATYWKQQLEFVKEGEKFFWYRGWSERQKETGMGLFDHIHQGILMYDGMITATDAEQNLLYERALWYNARLLYWLWLEGASDREKNAAFAYLAKMYELRPNDDLVRMYNGEKIDVQDPFDEAVKPANAPVWAFNQWEMTNRLKYFADWWVKEQQSETGEFGGKFGDDVEILRWWSPLILSGDTVVYNGWKKLADGVYNSSKVYKGYAKDPSDVEHSSEFIADTAPLMVLFSDDQEYANRLSFSSDYFQNLWTGINDKGDRFFKSAWFSSTEIETEPPKNRDVAYNARATKAVRYYAWKTRDEATIKALKEWADGWYNASQRTDKGKPLGIIPPSIEFPSGDFNGDEETWYTANMFWEYFDWNGSHAILDQLLFTWTLTGDEKYLEPITQHIELVSEYKSSIKNSDHSFEEGSEEWAASILGNNSNFWNVVGTWRLLTGIDTYDEIIIENGTPFIKYRLTGNEEYLIEGMKPYLDAIRYNEPIFTSEVIHTDRVFITDDRVREAGILQGMITGYSASESSSPYISISWEDASRDITYLVTDSDSSHVELKLYSFSDKQEDLTMRLWQLSNGEYALTQKGEKGKEENRIEITKRGERFPVTIPSKELIELEITRLK